MFIHFNRSCSVGTLWKCVVWNLPYLLVDIFAFEQSAELNGEKYPQCSVLQLWGTGSCLNRQNMTFWWGQWIGLSQCWLLLICFSGILPLWSKHYDLIALYTTLSTKSHYMHTGPARAYRLTRQQPWVEAQSGSKKDRYFSLSFGHSFGIIALISTSYLPLVIIILN